MDILRNTLCLLLFIILLQSCSSNKENSKPEVYQVEIKQMKFQPSELILQKGDTVIWVNNDLVPHNVTEVNKAWASPIINNGRTWKMAVEKSSDYYCTIHPMMKGKLIVE